MSKSRRPRLAPLLPILLAPAMEDVTFSCPWCSTNLSLPQKDFMNERAVLCPRCNNPIDMEIQRKLHRSAPPGAKAPPSKGTLSPNAPRREVTLPKRREAPRKEPPPPAPVNPTTSDWSKPLDVDAAFGTDRARKSQVDQLMGGWQAGRQPGSQAGSNPTQASENAPALGGGKIHCPYCDFENSAGYDPFRTGPPKCAWCGKLLPQ